MQRCMALFQDKVSWEAGNPDQTHWADANLRRLCGTSRPPEAMVACFQQQLGATQDWSTALETCVAEAAADTSAQSDVAEAFDDNLGAAYGDLGDTSSDGGYRVHQYIGAPAAVKKPDADTTTWPGYVSETYTLSGSNADVSSPEEPAAHTSPNGKARPPRPSAMAVWVEGKWVLKNNVYEWQEGHWEDAAASSDTQLTKDCMVALQDKVSHSPTDPDARHWPEEDLRRLCQSTAAVRDTVACFTEIMGETKDRELAISSCSRLHPM